MINFIDPYTDALINLALLWVVLYYKCYYNYMVMVTSEPKKASNFLTTYHITIVLVVLIGLNFFISALKVFKLIIGV